MSVDKIRKVAVLQRVCPGYRLALFQELSRLKGYKLRLFIGDDLPNSKVKSARDIDGVDLVRMNTKFVALGGDSPLVIHAGLFNALASFAPDLIVSEGESNLFSLLAALLYARVKGIPVLHWSLGGLPGEAPKSGFRKLIRNLIRRRFDAFIVYSSFGKACLVKDGMSSDKVFVAVNVPDVQRLLKRAEVVGTSKQQARKKIGVPDKFTILYVGSMDTPCKRLELLVDIARSLRPDDCNIVCVGDGQVRNKMVNEAQSLGLNHLFLPGAINAGIDDYYLAADLFVLPGRGGMVIAEAMAFGLPVIAYNADGTERDLIENGVSGVLLESGGVEDFVRVIRNLMIRNDHRREMSSNAKASISRFGLANMVSSIGSALECTR
ncbi:MAG TPA: glycosyltransferase family 4 protein [Dongiaceae bacterium]|nr:glycosyltransferase family 4 protein [Dongiaceae bacterium]